MSNASRIHLKFQILTDIEKFAKRAFPQSRPPIKAGALSLPPKGGGTFPPMVAGDFSPATMGGNVLLWLKLAATENTRHVLRHVARNTTQKNSEINKINSPISYCIHIRLL